MVTCEDIAKLRLDGVSLVAGEKGLDRMVSWTYMVQTRPYADHMNRGNFALIVVDDIRFSMNEAEECMLELYELGISGLGISIVDDREDIPEGMKAKADELALPLFFVRWEGASFVDIAQSIGRLILEQNVQNKRAGDFLYNLLFGYDINDDSINAVDVKHECMHRHLLITAIGNHVIRMIPPLIIDVKDCDKAYEIIKKSVEAETDSFKFLR